MNIRPTHVCLLLAGIVALGGLATEAAADNRCSSPYVWGHQSYFGDRFVYSHRHAYPRHSYRSSRHYIYYRRVPHFYSSSYNRTHTSNYYASPEYRAYFNRGPYFEPSEYYGDQRYESPNTRPYTPSCEPDDVNGGNGYSSADESVSYELERSSQPVIQNVDDLQRRLPDPRLIAAEAESLIKRGWNLLDEGNSATAMPVFAKAAMLRSDDVAPRIGYAIAATMEGHDMIAAWAMRRGILTDANALVDVELSDNVGEAMRNEFDRVRAVESDDDDAQRDAVVIAAVLAILLDNSDELDELLQRLAALDEPATMQALIKASKARIAFQSESAENDSVASAQ